MLFTIPVSAWSTTYWVEFYKDVNYKATGTTLSRCRSYAKNIMGHKTVLIGKEKIAYSKQNLLDMVYQEITNGRPIVLYAKRKDGTQDYHWVLAYKIKVENGKYGNMRIVDPLVKGTKNTSQYIVSLKYRKVLGEHIYNEYNKRVEIVTFAAKRVGNNAGKIRKFIDERYGEDSRWATNMTFASSVGYYQPDWCCCFVNLVYDKCGMDPHAIQYQKKTPNSIYNPLCSAEALMGQAYWNGKFRKKENYTPQMGDIIFFDNNSDNIIDGNPDHVGIVERVSGGRVYTIEGNIGGNDEPFYNKGVRK